MAESNVVELNVQPSREKLLELLSTTHQRLMGVMGFCEALSTGRTDFEKEAAAEIAHIIDDICGAEMFDIVHAYRKRVECQDESA